MTTIKNTIKPTILISFPTQTPSNQFTARLPTTFLPIRTKPLSSSSKPLSVAVKCSDNMNLPSDSSDSLDDEFKKKSAAAREYLYGKNKHLKEMWCSSQEKLKKYYEVFVWLKTQDDAVREQMKPYMKALKKEIAEGFIQAATLFNKEMHTYLSATVPPEDVQKFKPAAERELAKQDKEFDKRSFTSEEDLLQWMLGIEEGSESTEGASLVDFI